MFILDNCRNNLRGEQWQTVHKTALKWMRLRERGERDISYKIESVKKRVKKTLITLLCVDESKIKCCLTGDLHADKVDHEYLQCLQGQYSYPRMDGHAYVRLGIMVHEKQLPCLIIVCVQHKFIYFEQCLIVF